MFFMGYCKSCGTSYALLTTAKAEEKPWVQVTCRCGTPLGSALEPAEKYDAGNVEIAMQLMRAPVALSEIVTEAADRVFRMNGDDGDYQKLREAALVLERVR